MGWAIGCLVVVIVIAVASFFGVPMMVDKASVDLKAGRFEAAQRILSPLAHLGVSTAQYLMGHSYAFGEGVPENVDQALYWFRRANMEGCTRLDPGLVAAHFVAKQLAELSEPENAERAARWKALAATSGYEEGKGC